MNLQELKKGCEKGTIRQEKVYEKGTFSLKNCKISRPQRVSSSCFRNCGLSCSAAIEKQDTFFYYFRCQALKMKTLIIRDWKKEKESRVCLYVRAVTRTQITRDSADQDIVHMKETRSGKKRVNLFMKA